MNSKITIQIRLILPILYQLPERRLHSWLVLFVCNSKPVVIRGQYRELCSFLQHSIGNDWEKVFVLLDVGCGCEELRKAGAQHIKKLSRVTPEIHGDKALDVHRFPIRLCAIRRLNDVLGLCDAHKPSLIDRTYPSGHTTVIGQCVLQDIADEGVAVWMLFQEAGSNGEPVLPLVIIRIDHSERGAYMLCGAKNSLSGSPWLLS